MFSLEVPFVWDIAGDYTWRTKDEIIGQITEAAKLLLKGGIDWYNRLGYLIASGFDS
jgi:hypothetical protein